MIDTDLAEARADMPGGASTVRVCWIAFWSCVGLAIFKIAGGILGYSPLLIIDGLASAAIAAVITTILLGIRMSRQDSISKSYSYGKGKAQFLIAMITGILIGIAAVVVLGVSIRMFYQPVELESTAIGMTITLVAIAGNLLLVFYLRQVGSFPSRIEFKKTGRMVMLSVAASLVVVQSYILVNFGWVLGERVGRISISLILVWLSILIIKGSLEGVMDRRIGDQAESEIKALAGSVEGVRKIEWVRTRRAGHNVYIDLQVALDRDSTILQSDKVAQQVRKLLSSRMEQPPHAVKVEFCAF
jgi:cation diffusion facilitator family transporter